MGRTLHYQVQDKTFVPTDDQQNAIYALTKKYLDTIDWTCETPSFDFYDYYPNWDQLKKMKGRDVTMEEGWEIVNLSNQSKMDSGYSAIEARKRTQKEGIIRFSREGSLRTGSGKEISFDYFSGFCKTSGNELNAHAVIRFILECSFILKGIEISLEDEGNALYCPLIIKNGKAKPDIESIKSCIKHWNSGGYKELLHNPESVWDVTNHERYFNVILERKWNYGDPQQFIRQILDEGYLAERKQFQTIKLSLEKGFDLRDLVGDFLSNQRAESAKYYKDTKEFPTLKKNSTKKK
jgi:hypothetical protein